MRLPLRHLRGLCATGLLTLLLVTGLWTPSYGAAVAPEVPKTLSITVDLAPSGQVSVTELHTWLVSPGTTPRMSRQLPVFSPYAPDLLKKFEYSNFTAHVVTPESAETPLLTVLDNGANLEIQVTPSHPLGTPEDTEPAQFQVELTYDVMGTLSTTGQAAGSVPTDEFFWSPVTDSNLAYDQLDLQVTAPTPALTGSCDLTLPAVLADPQASSESTAESTQEATTGLDPEATEDPATAVPECIQDTPLSFAVTDFPLTATLTWRATFPDTTFARTEPLVVERPEAEESGEDQLAFDPTWTENLDTTLPSHTLKVGIGIALALALAGGVYFLVSRNRGDDRFVGAAPGQVPPEPQAHAIERAPATVLAARRTTAPEDLSVAECGALIYAGLRSREVGATLLSLAIGGHLHITELAGDSHWLLHKADPNKADLNETSADGSGSASQSSQDEDAPAQGALRPHEFALWNALFAGADQVDIVSLHANLAPTQLDVLRAVGQEVANHGLFKQSLSHESVNREGSKHRTALGRAYLEQLIGFEEFIKEPTPTELAALSESRSMAELFEAYLPYAVTFNCAHAWAKACDQVSHQPYAPTWLSSQNQPWDGTFTHVTAAVNRLADTAI